MEPYRLYFEKREKKLLSSTRKKTPKITEPRHKGGGERSVVRGKELGVQWFRGKIPPLLNKEKNEAIEKKPRGQNEETPDVGLGSMTLIRPKIFLL